MYGFVTVVGCYAEGILPRAEVGVLCILVEFVYGQSGGLERGYGVAAYAQTHAVGLDFRARTVLEKSEIVFYHERFPLVDAGLRLVGEQTVALRGMQRGHGLAVVVGAVAEEQQVTGAFALVGSPVVKHLHQSAIGCGVGGSRRKFVENLLLVHDQSRQSFGLMQAGYSLGFASQDGGGDDGEVGYGRCVQILVLDLLDEGR